jgi:sterol desaturase/sphingolipid hydroxylase (fatty acid hydroxylase superfamily)
MGPAVAIAIPVFFSLMALEYFVGKARGTSNYRLNDAVNSLSLGILSQVVNLFTRLLRIGIYAAVHSYLSIWQLPANQWWVWIAGIVAYDFCYYWNHRLGHESAIFWAAHVAHHQSQEYNLSTALRQTSTGVLLGWIFYLPMAIAGFPVEVFAVAAIANLFYQYWIHTEQIGKLGWFDRWFASPSNHRVHHAVNDRYIDRNYSGIFMAWDHLFGTFVEEDERCVYGTRSPLNSWDPIWANAEVYADLAKKSRVAPHWPEKLLIWLKPPGWQRTTADGTRWRPPHFDVTSLQRFDPPMTRQNRWFAAFQLPAAIVAMLPLLWFENQLSTVQLAAGSIVVVTVLWATGAVMQGRLRIVPALALEAAVLALVLGWQLPALAA